MSVLTRWFPRAATPARAEGVSWSAEELTDRDTPRSRIELRARIEQCRWVHCIDLGDGTMTPGSWTIDTQQTIRRAFDDVDFHDAKVVDIGCWDGLWSFEAERRGAREVYATDFISQRSLMQHRTLPLARAYMNSRVRYFPRLPVHEVSCLGVTDFDVVIFNGVYYHLKDPVLAFSRLRQVMKEGATLIVEGEVIDSPDCFARFYYHEHYARDRSNWWVPTIPCLRQWVECSFFEILKEYSEDLARRRFVLTARAVRRRDPNYGYPDLELAGFDLNAYE